jgi:hypothetical protein
MSKLERYNLWSEMLRSFFSSSTYRISQWRVCSSYTDRSSCKVCVICPIKRRQQKVENFSVKILHTEFEKKIVLLESLWYVLTAITKLVVASRSGLRNSLKKSLHKLRVLLTPHRQHWASVRSSRRSCSVRWHKCTELTKYC